MLCQLTTLLTIDVLACCQDYMVLDIAAGRSACLSTEGLHRSLRTGHHHTCQLVTADRKVSSTLQISAGAAATEEGRARQVVASQLQADI